MEEDEMHMTERPGDGEDNIIQMGGNRARGENDWVQGSYRKISA